MKLKEHTNDTIAYTAINFFSIVTYDSFSDFCIDYGNWQPLFEKPLTQDEEFLQGLRRAIERHRPTLEKLAQK